MSTAFDRDDGDPRADHHPRQYGPRRVRSRRRLSAVRPLGAGSTPARDDHHDGRRGERQLGQGGTGAPGGFVFGGGMSLDVADITITGTQIEGNQAKGGAGARAGPTTTAYALGAGIDCGVATPPDRHTRHRQCGDRRHGGRRRRGRCRRHRGQCPGAGLNFYAGTFNLTGVAFVGNQSIAGRGRRRRRRQRRRRGPFSGRRPLRRRSDHLQRHSPPLPTPAITTVTNATFVGNLAQGGKADRAAAPGPAGPAESAPAALVYNDAFSTLDLSSAPLIERCQGRRRGPGGSSGGGGDGGDGLGGASITRGRIPHRPDRSPRPRPSDTVIIGNLAQGGDAGEGDPDGAPAKAWAAASTSLRWHGTLKKTIVAGNHASTSNDDIYGSYTTT